MLESGKIIKRMAMEFILLKIAIIKVFLHVNLGQFNTFEKHGYGIENFTNGDIYKGNYMHGKPHGYGEYIWQNKIQYKGNFIKGMR